MHTQADGQQHRTLDGTISTWRLMQTLQRARAGLQLCLCFQQQTKEEREAREAAAHAERDAAEAKEKAKADKEAAMKEFAETMAKVPLPPPPLLCHVLQS